MLDDDAKYQCQVGPGLLGEPGIRSKFASLTILVPPEPPRIVQGDFLVTTEDREIELECVSLAGKPAAEVSNCKYILLYLVFYNEFLFYGPFILTAKEEVTKQGLGSQCTISKYSNSNNAHK